MFFGRELKNIKFMKISKRISALVLSLLLASGNVQLAAFADSDRMTENSSTVVVNAPIGDDSAVRLNLPNGSLDKKEGVQFSSKDLLLVKQAPLANNNTASYVKADYSSDCVLDAIDGKLEEAYLRLYNACINVHENVTEYTSSYQGYYFATTVDLSGLSVTDAQALDLFNMLSDFNPQFYWINSKYLYALDSNGYVTTFVVAFEEDYLDTETRKSCNQLIDEKVQEYKATADEFDSDYEKVYAIHNKLVEEISYAEDADGNPVSDKWAHSVIGVFDESYGQAVCEGYANAFTLVLNSLGIDSFTVRGNSFSGTYGAHAWNLVKLDDGMFYWFDATWNDSLASDGFFATTDDEFGYTHFYGDSVFNDQNFYTIEMPDIADEPFDLTILKDAPSETFTITQNGFTFKANPDDNTCILTGFSGNGDVTIPSQTGAYTVVEIAENAFSHNYSITSVNIPSSVKTIRANAFEFCTSLGTVTIEAADRIEENAFSGCSDLNSVTLGNDVKSLGKEAFLGCRSLCEITLPSGLVHLGEKCFENTSLEKIEMSAERYNPIFTAENGVLLNGQKNVLIAFAPKYDAEDYIIPESVVAIAESAFSSNSTLLSVNTNNVKEIGDYAFEGTDLIYAEITDSAEKIGSYAFYECLKLGAVRVSSSVDSIGNKAIGFYYDRQSLCDAVLQKTTVYCEDSSAVKAYADANGIKTDSYENEGYTEALLSAESFTYTGAEITPDVTVTYNGKPLVDEAYSVIYTDNINCGTAVAEVVFTDERQKAITLVFEITPETAENAFDAELEFYSAEFTGNEIRPLVTVKFKDVTLTENVDYVISYAENISVGTAEVTITGVGNFCSKIKKSFEIVSQTAHNFIPEIIEPTCEERGYTIYTCEDCEISYTDDYTEPTGHTEIIDEAVIPTCTKSGLTEGKHCSVCETVITPQQTIPAAGHSYTETVIAPTYTTKGYTLHDCENCDYSYTDNYTDALPSPVANVTGLTLTSNTTSSIKMTWNKVNGATGYVVYQAIGGKWQRIKVTSANSLTVSGLNAGTNYRFTVKAYKTVSGKNVYSASYTGVWMTTTPATPTMTLSSNKTNSVTLKWNKVTGASGYIVYQAVNGKWQRLKVTTAAAITVSSLKAGTTYNFTVKAYKTFGGKNYYGSYKAFSTTTLPATPTMTLSSNKTNSVSLKWNKVTGASGYIVYQAVNGKWQRLKVTTAAAITVSSLKAGTTYNFTVKAYKTFGGKNYNGSFKAFTATTLPAKTAITSLTSTVKGKLSLKYNKVSGANGYQIRVSTSPTFASGNKTYSATSTSVSVSSFTSSKRYYVRVRAFKTLNGKKYYGSWSTSKSVVCK